MTTNYPIALVREIVGRVTGHVVAARFKQTIKSQYYSRLYV